VGPDNKEVATKDDIVADEVYVGSGEMPAGYVLQIDPTGEASGIVEDVKINDISIVTDGVANIPVADINNLGVVKLGNNHGLSKTGDIIVVTQASNSNISERNNVHKPITSTNLDYAVKAALTDGKGEAYTSEEQQAARERLGVIDTNEIYIGSDEMPEGCVLRINPEGEATPVVNDIKINDTSIVEGGVANIPIAKPLQHGLPKFFNYGTHGLFCGNDGTVTIAQATEENIDNKVQYKPITPYTFDYAYLSARKRLEAWEEICDITVEEDVEQINIDFEYPCKEIYVYISQENCETKITGTRYLYPKLFDDTTLEHTLGAYVKDISSLMFDVFVHCINYDNKWIKREHGAINPQPNTTSVNAYTKVCDTVFNKNITSKYENNLNFYSFYSDMGNKGTRIRILGVRA
jgi:hypothetical protein